MSNYRSRSFVAFDVSSLSADSIDSVKFNIFKSSANETLSGRIVSLHYITSAWTEGAWCNEAANSGDISGNNQPTWENDADASWNQAPVGSWVEVDVTDRVKTALAQGATEIGWMLNGTGGCPCSEAYASDESAKPPFLSVSKTLVAYYPLDGDATDASGNGHDGLVYGATPTTDRFGRANGAMSFDGINDYIDLEATATKLIGGRDQMSIGMWVRDDLRDEWNFLLSDCCHGDLGWCVNTNNVILARIWALRMDVVLGVSDPEYWDWHADSTGSPIPSGWVHYLITYDGNVLKTYLNGQLRWADSTHFKGQIHDGALSRLELARTMKSNGDYHYAELMVDDVRIYDYALSESEIQDLLCEQQTYYRDADEDGFGDPDNSIQACEPPSGYIQNNTDCDDDDPDVNPAAAEACNGQDDDCDLEIDEGVKSTYYADADSDGYGNPDGSTQSCSQPAGHVANNVDCDDNNAGIYPGAVEIFNGKDDDCDNQVDEGASTYYRDGDADGYGNPDQSTQAFTQPAGYVSNNTDCDDNDANVNPGAAEILNGKDDDCDDQIDEGGNNTYYKDEDADGFGNPNQSTQAFAQPAGYVANSTDCDDTDPNINPAATEIWNGKDDDCDDQVDEGGSTYYRDADADGYGDPGDSTQACSQPAGYVSNSNDCDDSDSGINPAAAEICNGKDDDCDNQVDEGGNTYYRDADADGYGDPGDSTQACSIPAGYAANSNDCNDSDPNINPAATEICNGKDDDCDNQIDEELKKTYYRDEDADGYGNANVSLTTCPRPDGYVLDNTDCNDADSAINPGAAEVCNEKDDNCDNQVDEGVLNTYYQDLDSDGYGNPDQPIQSCSRPGGYVANDSDCNDSAADINPAAEEICNGRDDNCNGLTDEGLKNTYYLDQDGDGYGHPDNSLQACSRPSGYVDNNLDCNDSEPNINPGAREFQNGLDDDCDGLIDEEGGLEPPQNLQAGSTVDDIRLDWVPSPSPNLVGHNVYRGEAPDGPWTKINADPVEGAVYVDQDANLVQLATYYYHVTGVDGLGGESEPSDWVAVIFGQLKLFIPNSNGSNGSQVRIPVNIDNADGLEMCSVDVAIGYDQNVLQALDIERSAMTADYGWAKNLTTPGVVRAIIVSADAGEKLYGEGSLFYLTFEVLGESGDTSVLQFDVDLTSFYDCKDLYNDISLDLTDVGVFTVDSQYILGDVNGDGRVNSADASLALNIAVGNIEPSDYQHQAGDVNGDGKITSADVALIMRIAVGLPLAPENNDSITETRESRAGEALVVSLPANLTVKAGQSVAAPVRVSNMAGIMGADITINFDPGTVSLTGIEKTENTRDFTLAYNTVEDGQVRISLSAVGGDGLPQQAGELINLLFASQTGARGQSTRLTLVQVRFNDTYGRDFARSSLQKDIETINGKIRVTGSQGVTPGLTILLKDD